MTHEKLSTFVDLLVLADLLQEWLIEAGDIQFEGQRQKKALELAVEAGINLRSACFNLDLIETVHGITRVKQH